MAIRKTNEEWVREVKELVKEEYTFLEDYINNKTKIAVVHNLCNHIYEVAPGTFLRGNRCPNCNPYRLKTTAKFKEEVYQLVGTEYTVVSEYKGHHKYITMKHEECGVVYRVLPSDFLKGRRCRECHFKGRRKTNKEWLEQVKTLAGDEYKFLERYKGDNIKIRYRHSCGAEHEVAPNNFINGTRCPYCLESTGEANVRRYLIDKGIVFEVQKGFKGLTYKKPLTYDFYLPQYNILIEFQGVQHYKPNPFFGGDGGFENQRIRDNIKREFAKSHEYRLIEVHYSNDTYEKVKTLLESTIFSNEYCSVTQGALNQN